MIKRLRPCRPRSGMQLPLCMSSKPSLISLSVRWCETDPAAEGRVEGQTGAGPKERRNKRLTACRSGSLPAKRRVSERCTGLTRRTLPLNDARDLGPSLDAAERRPLPHPTGHELEGARRDLLAGFRHADDGRDALALVASLEDRARLNSSPRAVSSMSRIMSVKSRDVYGLSAPGHIEMTAPESFDQRPGEGKRDVCIENENPGLLPNDRGRDVALGRVVVRKLADLQARRDASAASRRKKQQQQSPPIQARPS